MKRRALLASLFAAPLVPLALRCAEQKPKQVVYQRTWNIASPHVEELARAQKLQTALLRQMADNLYLTSHPYRKVLS